MHVRDIPVFFFFWDDIVFCLQQFATQIALIHTSICFPYRKDRIFLSKSTRSAMGGLYAFRFYSFSADVDRVGFDKVQVLTFCVCSPLKLGHSFNHKYFLSPPGLLTLAALLSPAKYRQKHSYQPQIQSTPSRRGWQLHLVSLNPKHSIYRSWYNLIQLIWWKSRSILTI